MTLVVPNTSEIVQLTRILSQTLTIKLFRNDLVPDGDTVLGDIDEASGGGYIAQELSFASWDISIVTDIATGLYNTFISWNFTGPVFGGNIYGYYVVNSLNELQWAERFPDSQLPYVPILNSLARVKPRYTLKQAV